MLKLSLVILLPLVLVGGVAWAQTASKAPQPAVVVDLNSVPQSVVERHQQYQALHTLSATDQQNYLATREYQNEVKRRAYLQNQLLIKQQAAQ